MNMPVLIGARFARRGMTRVSGEEGLARTARLAVALAVTTSALLVTDAPAQQTRPIQPDDYYRVQSVGSPQISPDGRYLLYTVQTVRQEENDRITHIWFTDLETGQNQRLSTAGVNSTNPSWTPDGRRVYFNTTRGGESGMHFLNFMDPGGEAYRIEGIPNNPDFSPDGTWILVEREVDPNGNIVEGGRGGGPGNADDEATCWPAGTPALTGPTDPTTRGKTEEERNCDVYVITHSNYKSDGNLAYQGPGGRGGGGGRGGRGGGGGGGGGDDDTTTQFFRIPAHGLAPGAQPEPITTDAQDKSFEGFSPDGEWILYTVDMSPGGGEGGAGRGGRGGGGGGDEEELDEVGIYRVDIDGGTPDEIVRVQGNVGGISISPNNRRLAFTLNLGDDDEEFIRVVDVGSGETIADVGQDWRWSIGSPVFSANSNEVYWTSTMGVVNQVVKAPATGGEVTQVTDGLQVVGGVTYSDDMTRMAYTKSAVDRPTEVYVADADGSDEQQVTHINDEWMNEVRLSPFEKFTFEGVPHNREWLDQLKERGVRYMLDNNAPSGERPEIEALLIYPLDYVEGRTYPMVVSIHGGPHSRYSAGWFHEFQMLAATGMFVLYTNPRGSSAYGDEFQTMTLNAWGIDDAKDILQATDMVVERGLADPDRLGVTGGSYGGFMTNWLTSQDQRWKAAITARSIANWMSFYGVSDASSLVEREFDGMPWPFEHPDSGSYELATMLSPIVWADRVVTPTLIVHSINDYRVPLAEGEQWYRALQKNDVPVKMVLFPDSSHGLSRGGEPWLLVRRLEEYVNWFKAYLVDDTPIISQNDGGG